MNDPSNKQLQVGVIMGSASDWETVRHTCEVLGDLGIAFEKRIVSAHRTPHLMYEYAQSAKQRGLKVIIAAAGGAAHLPGMTASLTGLPVIGIPIESKSMKGMDSLFSIVQMPAEVPVATVAIGRAGAINAGIMAGRILGAFDEAIAERLELRMKKIREEVLSSLPEGSSIPDRQ